MKAKRDSIWKTISITLGLVFIFLVWYLIAGILRAQQNYGVPFPHETIVLSVRMLFTSDPEGVYSASSTWSAIGWSMLRLIIGYSISFLLAGLFGILAGLFQRIGDFFKPSVGFLKTVPTVGLVMILFSLTLAIDHKYLGWIPVVLVFVVAFPLLFEAFKAGIQNEEDDVMDALRLEGNIRSPSVVFGVLLPDAWPFIRLGIAQSLGLSFKVLIMSEVLTSSNKSEGLGCLISQVRTTSMDGGVSEIPAYVLISLALMALIDLPYIILKTKQNSKK